MIEVLIRSTCQEALKFRWDQEKHKEGTLHKHLPSGYFSVPKIIHLFVSMFIVFLFPIVCKLLKDRDCYSHSTSLEPKQGLHTIGTK